MLILGLDTSTERSSVCLGSGEGLLAAASSGRPQRHGEVVAPAIDWCLQHAGVGLEDVTAVAVTLGPGLYTGLRVGIATAQTLAHARGLAAVGRSSLDVLAAGLREPPEAARVWAVIDARRGELFWAPYRAIDGSVVADGPARVGKVDELGAEVEAAGTPARCVGDGAVAHAERLEQAGARVASPWLAHPSADVLTELAATDVARGATVRPGELQPVYLRPADARIGWRQRGAVRGGAGAAVGSTEAAPAAAPGGAGAEHAAGAASRGGGSA